MTKKLPTLLNRLETVSVVQVVDATCARPQAPGKETEPGVAGLRADYQLLDRVYASLGLAGQFKNI